MTNFAANLHNTVNTIRADFYSPTAKKNIPEMLKSLAKARNEIITAEAVAALDSKSTRAMANSAANAYNEICRKMSSGKHAEAFAACLIKHGLAATIEMI